MKRAPRPRCRSRARGCLPALPEQAPPPQAPKKRRDHPPQRRRPRPGRPARARAPEPAAGPSGGPGGCPMTTAAASGRRQWGVPVQGPRVHGCGVPVVQNPQVAVHPGVWRRQRPGWLRRPKARKDQYHVALCVSILARHAGGGRCGSPAEESLGRSGDRQGGKVANNFTSGVAATKRLEQERLRPDGGEKNVQRTVESRLGAVFASCPARTGMGGR